MGKSAYRRPLLKSHNIKLQLKNTPKFATLAYQTTNSISQYILMATTSSVQHEFWHGEYIRALAIHSQGNTVNFAMEDLAHAFKVQFSHNGQNITAIEAEWVRHPVTSCIGAEQQLQNLVGCPISKNILTAAQYQSANLHCSHMFNMLSIAIVHAAHKRADRRYDIIISEPQNDLVHTQIDINGDTVSAPIFNTQNEIISPEQYQGVSLNRGFTRWSMETLQDEKIEYAYLIQRTMQVAISQRIEQRHHLNGPASQSGPPRNACFASQGEKYDTAIRLNSYRDIAADKSKILDFIEVK